MTRKIGGFLLLVLILLVTSGCTRYISLSAQDNQTDFILLDNQTTVGQTFTARFNGLAGVGLTLNPNVTTTPLGAGEIILHLRANPQSSQDLRTASLSVQKVDRVGIYRFFFEPLPDSNQQDYYLLLEMTGVGEIGVSTAGNETFLDGGIYKNGVAAEGQLTFSLKYGSSELFIGLLKEIPRWLFWLLISLFLFILPGWGLLNITWPGWQKLDFLEKFGLSSGASLAIYPVLFLWTSLVGLHLGVLYAWLPALLGLVVLVWRNHKEINQWVFVKLRRFLFPSRVLNDSKISEVKIIQKNAAQMSDEGVADSPIHLSPVEWLDEVASKTAIVILIGVIIFSRIWVIRSLDFPLWGDSYQHTMISQLIVDNRGLFQYWLPYAELSTFTYHFGFHTLVACFNWISGLPMEKAILWVGEIVNILAVISLYPLARKLGNNRWTGAILLLIAGLISPMPMSYLNWGRYTQLAGQVILPAAVYCTWLLLQSDRLDRRALVANWIILGGLALTHYRVLIFMLLFLVAFFLMNMRLQPLSRLILKTFGIGVGGAFIFLPWLATIAPFHMSQTFFTSITTIPNQISSPLSYSNLIDNPFKFFPPIIWICLLVSIGWSLWRQEKNFATIILWWLLVFLAVNPNLIGFPGAGAIGNFTLQIGYYIPVGIILGAAAARVTFDLQVSLQQSLKLPPKVRTILQIIITATILTGCIALVISQLPQRIDDINPTLHAIVTRPDQRAAEWIQENISLDNRFLVNSVFAYDNRYVVGSDGGWWLPLLTKRLTTQPPLNYADEEGFVPNNVARVNQIPRAILTSGLTDPTVMNMLQKRGVTFVYLGQLHIREVPPVPLLDSAVLQNDPHFQLVYRNDQVWIFKINY